MMFRSRTFWRLFGTYGLFWLASIGLLGAVVVANVDGYERRRFTNSVRVRAHPAEDALRGQTGAPSGLQERAARLARAAEARITLIAADGRVLADSEEDAAVM